MASERAPAKSFRDLIVWRKAHELALAVYRFLARPWAATDARFSAASVPPKLQHWGHGDTPCAPCWGFDGRRVHGAAA